MRKQKYYLSIDDYEYSVIFDSLNNLRNKLITDGRYTDAVDDVILKLASSKKQSVKIKYS